MAKTKSKSNGAEFDAKRAQDELLAAIKKAGGRLDWVDAQHLEGARHAKLCLVPLFKSGMIELRSGALILPKAKAKESNDA